MNEDYKESIEFMRIWFFIFFIAINFIHADEAAEAARKIVEERQDAVVMIKVVLEMHDYENKAEVLGTIIDPSGLVILSLSSIDPSAMTFGLDSKTKIKSVKLLLSDGTEVPAKIVLRDRDLDIAFLRPTEKIEGKIDWIDLKKNCRPDMMEQVVLISRLGSVAGYTPYASICRIQAIVEKPRMLYVPGFSGIFGGLGIPAFNLSGESVGILLLKVTNPTRLDMGGIGGGIQSMGMLPVILPAEEILDAASHVPESGD